MIAGFVCGKVIQLIILLNKNLYYVFQNINYFNDIEVSIGDSHIRHKRGSNEFKLPNSNLVHEGNLTTDLLNEKRFN